MAKPAHRLTTVILVLAGASCGGNGSTAKDAAVTRDVGVDAGVSCAALPCLAGATALIAYCAPSGTCTEQVTASGTTSTQARCFANGVQIKVAGMRLASGGTSTVMTVQKDGATCYSMTATSDDASGSAGSVVYKDGAGVELVTERVDGATTMVTCPGAGAVVPDGSCDAALFALGGLYPFTNASGMCTTGSCSF